MSYHKATQNKKCGKKKTKKEFQNDNDTSITSDSDNNTPNIEKTYGDKLATNKDKATNSTQLSWNNNILN